jgi:hypothetical protein
MCYNCGCHIPDDDMGHPDNITGEMMRKIAKKLNQKGDGRQFIYDYLEKQNSDPDFKNPELEEMFLKASKAWGQTVKESKRQTYNMLKSEL